VSKVSPEIDIQGNPFGEVFPPRPKPPTLSVQPRKTALRLLLKYISTLSFHKPGTENTAPIEFQIPLSNMYTSQPDNEQAMEFPAIVVKPTQMGTYAFVGLSSYIAEASRDLFEVGKVLQVQCEFTEVFQLEVWAPSDALRSAILAGIETSLVPTEALYGLRLIMHDYFDQTVCFTLFRSMSPDNSDTVRNRRTAQIEIEMRFNIVNLVNYLTLQPSVDVQPTDPTDPDYEDLSLLGGT
jgi:hypothetical protein